MANTEKETMSESADRGPVLSRRGFIKLVGGAASAVAGSVILEAAPALAKPIIRGAEQGTMIDDHQRIISAELGGVKVEPLYIDAATRSGVYAILGENTNGGRVNYSGGQNAGRRVGVIEGVSPRQTVAFEALTAQAEDTGVKVEVGMKLPERTVTNYPFAGAAMLFEGLDKGVDQLLGMDTPIDRAAVALRSVKSPNGVILGEHSNMDVTPEVDPKLTLGIKDLAALIQRAEGNVGYVLKVGENEVKVTKATVVRDELVASAEVAAPGVVIRDNMLPTPAPDRKKDEITSYRMYIRNATQNKPMEMGLAAELSVNGQIIIGGTTIADSVVTEEDIPATSTAPKSETVYVSLNITGPDKRAEVLKYALAINAPGRKDVVPLMLASDSAQGGIMDTTLNITNTENKTVPREVVTEYLQGRQGVPMVININTKSISDLERNPDAGWLTNAQVSTGLTRLEQHRQTIDYLTGKSQQRPEELILPITQPMAISGISKLVK